jgi:hypothetical protein
LGTWVAHQRGYESSISTDRRERLNELGFDWDPLETDWEEGFEYLKRYKERIGNCHVPQRYKEHGYNLGMWVHAQRRNHDLSRERRQRLDALRFVWDPLEADWEEGLSRLELYKDEHGDCRVPQRYREHGYKLGKWVSYQRRHIDELSSTRRQRLDELSFVWDPFEADWEEGFSHLKRYAERVGNCRVPRSYKEDSYNLGAWVGTQRHSKKELSGERRLRLDELGFVWDPLEADWEEGFSHLKRYKERVGNCRVPIFFKEDGYNLGAWVGTQRRSKDELSGERRRRLDELGFEWDPSETAWEKGFSYLKRYKERVGDCRVPMGYKEDGYTLGSWVAVQRRSETKHSSEHRYRLDELGFVWDPLEADWEEGFNYLKRYKERMGDCRVLDRYKEEGGYNLGSWVGKQRRNKNELSDERRRRLDEMGFEWDPFETDWEKSFGYLKRYKERVGDCRVPRDHKEDGFSLGTWVANLRRNEARVSAEHRRRL